MKCQIILQARRKAPKLCSEIFFPRRSSKCVKWNILSDAHPPMPPQESSLGFRYLAWWLNPSCGPESWGGLGGCSGFIKCVQLWWPESWGGLGGDQEVWTTKSIKFRPPRSLRSLGNRTASLRSARTLRVLERRYASCQFICLRSVHTLWNDPVSDVKKVENEHVPKKQIDPKRMLFRDEWSVYTFTYVKYCY